MRIYGPVFTNEARRAAARHDRVRRARRDSRRRYLQALGTWLFGMRSYRKLWSGEGLEDLMVDVPDDLLINAAREVSLRIGFACGAGARDRKKRRWLMRWQERIGREVVRRDALGN